MKQSSTGEWNRKVQRYETVKYREMKQRSIEKWNRDYREMKQRSLGNETEKYRGVKQIQTGILNKAIHGNKTEKYREIKQISTGKWNTSTEEKQSSAGKWNRQVQSIKHSDLFYCNKNINTYWQLTFRGINILNREARSYFIFFWEGILFFYMTVPLKSCFS